MLVILLILVGLLAKFELSASTANKTCLNLLASQQRYDHQSPFERQKPEFHNDSTKLHRLQTLIE